jgi:hypothetical protein
VTAGHAKFSGPRGDGLEQRRLALSGRPGDDQRAPPSRQRVQQGLLGGRQLEVPAEQRAAPAREHLLRGEQPAPQRGRLGTGTDAKFGAQGPVQPVELAQRGMPVAVRRVPPHQGEVGVLVGRVELGHLRSAAVQAQQLQVLPPELVTARLGPLLVPVRGQQLAGVERERPPGRRDAGPVTGTVAGVGAGSGQGPAGQFLELRRVHGHRGTGTEQHLVAAEHHRVRHADGVPGVVRRLV